MKTSDRILFMSFTLGILMAMVSCNSTGEGSSKVTAGKEETEKVMKPPAVDIHTATYLGDLDAVRQHIAAGSDLDEREPTMQSTPLISAAVFGKTEIAGALMEAGADVNLQNIEGSTALHTAAFLCRLEIVEMLLEHGADTSLKNIYGSTALQSVAGPFEEVRAIYDEFSKNLGPMGFKLDYAYVEATRPEIASLLQ